MYSHPLCAGHDVRENFDHSARARDLLGDIVAVFGSYLDYRQPTPAPIAAVQLGHCQSYIKSIEDASTQSFGQLIGDGCYAIKHLHNGVDDELCWQSYDAMLCSAGAAINCVQAVCEEGSTCCGAFSCCRPPGHHAGEKEACGFCLANNAVIAAVYAREVHEVGRVAILDFDVHDGNGEHV